MPSATDASIDAAVANLRAGNLAVASRSVTQLLEQHPHDHRVLHLAAAAAMEEKRFQDSQQLIERALAAAPTPQEQAGIWNTSARLGKAVGNSAHVEEAYRRAVLLDPATVDHALQFAEALANRGKLDAAIDVLRGTIARHPRDPSPCVTLGDILIQAGRQRDALAFYDMALKRDPNHAAAHFNAGVALTMLGNLDAARTATQTALKLDPTMSGYTQLASLDALKVGDEAIDRLEMLMQQADAPLEARIDAGFALARAYDSAGDAARAFPPLAQANAFKRATLDYDIRNDEVRTERIIALFTRDFMERFRGISDSKLAPIFVLGMPRSGTTLVEQMLAGHSQVQAGGELPVMVEIAKALGETWGARGQSSPGTDDEVRADLRHAAATYTHETRGLQGRKPHFTDKMPGNFLFIGLIHIMFPDARIIHCRRDPVDTCLSCYQRLFSSDVPYSYDLTELGHYYRLYQRLMAHWHAILPPGRILDVDYEAMVEEPEQGLRRILSFCGLDYEAECLDFQNVRRTVSTASAVQVRQGLYKTSVHRWKKYGSNLDALLIALGQDPFKA
jgi:cytochrome c-type biogenesis protein CcmH/NrfG